MRRPVGVLITSAVLKRAGACPSFRKAFRKKYPKGVIANSETCTKAGNSRIFGYRWQWAAFNFLNEAGIKHFSQYDFPIQTTSVADRRVRAAVFGALIERVEYRKPGIFKSWWT